MSKRRSSRELLLKPIAEDFKSADIMPYLARAFEVGYDEGYKSYGKGVAYRGKELTNNCYGTLSTTDDIRKGSTEKYPTSIIRYPKPHPSIAVHPTQKSVELCEWLIKTYTREGDVVLDNCMGSGSTMVACVKTHRRGIGIEKDDNYYNIAQERVKTSLITSAL